MWQRWLGRSAKAKCTIEISIECKNFRLITTDRIWKRERLSNKEKENWVESDEVNDDLFKFDDDISGRFNSGYTMP
jgi:tRNA(Ile)-lysidine synthase TilS/MesJ